MCCWTLDEQWDRVRLRDGERLQDRYRLRHWDELCYRHWHRVGTLDGDQHDLLDIPLSLHGGVEV